MQNTDSSPQLSGPDPHLDSAARYAGILLALTALFTVFAVIGRVLSNTDQAVFVESLNAISRSRFLYGGGGAARMFSGISLGVAAWFLMKTWIIEEGFGSRLVPLFFLVSGIFTSISGGCGLFMAWIVPTDPQSYGVILERIEAVRELSGKAGFSAAGLSILIAAK